MSRTVALVVIDMQNDFVLPGAPACVAGALPTVPTIRCLLDKARSEGWAIFHVVRAHRPDGSDVERTRAPLFKGGQGLCVEGSTGADIVAGLEPLPGEYRIVKHRYSAFMGTEFDAMLRRLGVETLVVAGTQYPNCVRGTAVDGFALDYQVVVVTDACSAQSEAVAQANIHDMRTMGMACVPLAELDGVLPVKG